MKCKYLIILFLIVFGCINPPRSTSVPADFEVTYSYGACHAEWGVTTITIDANGNGNYESTIGTPNEAEFTVSEEDLMGLLNKIDESGFYSLNDYYSDPLTVDGSCQSIFITKNNITKSVAISNTPAPEAYSTVADAISEIVKSNKNW